MFLPKMRAIILPGSLRQQGRIEGEQLLRFGDTAQRISSHRYNLLPDGLYTDEGRRHQNGLVNRPAHRCNPADLVHRGANDGKVEPLMAANIAVKDVSYMQTKIHVGRRLALRQSALVQGGDTPARANRCRHRRGACMGPLVRGENGKRSIADQLQYIAAMLVNFRDDNIRVVVE